MDKLKQQWTSKKPVLLGLVVGLLAGPLISGIMGWQVSSAFLQRTVHIAVVQQQVVFCELRARAGVKNVGKLDYSGRYDVALLWAKLPGQPDADSEVVSGCTYALGS